MTIIDLDNLNVVGEISLGFVLLSLKKKKIIWLAWDISNVDKLERTVPVLLSYGDREKHAQQKRTVQ